MREDWAEYKFKDVATAIKGRLPKSKNEDGIGIPYLTASYLRSSKPDYWIENIEGAVTAEDGDCLILWDGAGAGDLFSAHRGVVSSTMAVVTTQNSKILREFLTLFISSKADYIKETCRGTTVPHVSPDAIANMDLKIPPLPEQKRIVDVISSVDSYIKALQQQLENAKRSRNAVLHELLTAGGDDWVESKLSSVTDLITDGSHFSPPTTDTGIPYVTVRDIKNGQLDLDNSARISKQSFEELEKSGCSPLMNDILFSKDGTVGKVSLVSTNEKFVVLSSLAIIRANTKMVLPKFLAITLSAPDFQRDAIGSKTGLAIKRIVLKHLRELSINLPPILEQSRITELIEVLDEVIKKTEQTFIDSKKLRSGLLNDLLNGEHEIPSSYDKVMGAAL